ncbi:hypothetical protein BDV95DRAFT_134007 [Massariosphaeria phaeospora]|uniref:Opsin-1 n=1 Tax=Massariosphaeria phaeospora TaxID=100035 RepID=A0A7C8MCG8_9PLEO|nr:hypothetical protein BDV95DRAFT_134007 [Massariosphaeria phaeospora]
MVIDPVEVLKKTSTGIIPTSLPSVSSLPSVLPDPIDQQFVGEAGSKTLWVVFVVMVISSAVFTGLSWRVPAKRLYHVVTTLITIIAAISYFGMATGQGISVNHISVRHQHDHVPDTYTDVQRQVYWARYVDWSLTTPLLLLDLALLAGLNGAHITIAIAADLIMILTGLFAAFGSDDTPQKWGWYTIACIAFLVIIWQLAINGNVQAKAKGDNVGKFFTAISGFTLVVWTLYPIVWGIADGSRKMSVDAEIITYAVLDILAKPVFGTWLLYTHARVPETNVDLGGFWSEGLSREGGLRLGDDDGA